MPGSAPISPHSGTHSPDAAVVNCKTLWSRASGNTHLYPFLSTSSAPALVSHLFPFCNSTSNRSECQSSDRTRTQFRAGPSRDREYQVPGRFRIPLSLLENQGDITGSLVPWCRNLHRRLVGVSSNKDGDRHESDGDVKRWPSDHGLLRQRSDPDRIRESRNRCAHHWPGQLLRRHGEVLHRHPRSRHGATHDRSRPADFRPNLWWKFSPPIVSDILKFSRVNQVGNGSQIYYPSAPKWHKWAQHRRVGGRERHLDTRHRQRQPLTLDASRSCKLAQVRSLMQEIDAALRGDVAKLHREQIRRGRISSAGQSSYLMRRKQHAH